MCPLRRTGFDRRYSAARSSVTTCPTCASPLIGLAWSWWAWRRGIVEFSFSADIACIPGRGDEDDRRHDERAERVAQPSEEKTEQHRPLEVRSVQFVAGTHAPDSECERPAARHPPSRPETSAAHETVMSREPRSTTAWFRPSNEPRPTVHTSSVCNCLSDDNVLCTNFDWRRCRFSAAIKRLTCEWASRSDAFTDSASRSTVPKLAD